MDVKDKVRLRLARSNGTDYNEVQWVLPNGKVIGQIVAHMGNHEGRSEVGGHLSIYIFDTEPDHANGKERRGAIDIDFCTDQNNHKPVARFENMGVFLTQGSELRQKMRVDGKDKVFLLGRKSDGTAIWLPSETPEYP